MANFFSSPVSVKKLHLKILSQNNNHDRSTAESNVLYSYKARGNKNEHLKLGREGIFTTKFSSNPDAAGWDSAVSFNLNNHTQVYNVNFQFSFDHKFESFL